MDRFSNFTLLLNGIVRCIHKLKWDEMSRLGLKGAHVTCLYYLYRAEKPLTARELCDECGEDKAAVSRALDFLGREGYVCGEETMKKYRSPVRLTERGLAVGKTVAEKIDAILSKAREGISAEDTQAMYRALRAIERNLKEICQGEERNVGKNID